MNALESLIDLVARFRAHQDASGAVVREVARAQALLAAMPPLVDEMCRATGQSRLAGAFAADLAEWSGHGLSRPPDFQRVCAAFTAPADGERAFFIGAALAQNGPPPRGQFLELFLVRREEPVEVRELMARFPHPTRPCQSTRLLAASPGFAEGNCIVFFPEYIATSAPVERQDYAIFFFDKFQGIYQRETLPSVRRLLGDHDWASARLAPDACYAARSVWGYLHDYHHHRGARPLHLHLQLKKNVWHCALLEELRADASTALTLHAGRGAYWREVIEFILFERLFRYPAQPDREENFDSGTGFFLFEWLRRRGALASTTTGLALDRPATLAALADLVATIDEAERLTDDDAYVARCIALVRDVVPTATDDGRLRVPAIYAAMAS